MDRHCILKTRKDNIHDCIEENEGLVVLYGANIWGEMLLKSGEFHVDFFCDRKAAGLPVFNNISVVNIDGLESQIRESGKRAVIIISASGRGTVMSIYGDLMKKDLNADVFDYFENETYFRDTEFFMEGKRYSLFEHSYNCGYISARMTERSVELALAKKWVNDCCGNIIEIGAVTPYYFYDDKITEVIDPTDIHKRAISKSLFDCDLNGKNVLSISTVEHIGTSDFGMHESYNVIDAVEKILKESVSCLITAPLGYNNMFDNWVEENQGGSMVKLLERGLNNHWEEITGNYRKIEYTPLWANGLAVIKK